MNWIVLFFSRIREILLKPANFFREMPRHGGFSDPLAFALTTHWLGAALNYLWHTLLSPVRPLALEQMIEKFGGYSSIDHSGRHLPWTQFAPSLVHWFFGMTSVIADPFVTLISLLFASALIFIGARLLVPAGQQGTLSEVTYESAVRVLCYAMAPSVLAGIPIFGSGVSWFYTWVVTIIGIKEVYRVSTGNSILISLFPKLLILGIIIMGIVIFSLFFLQLFVTGW